MNNPIQNVKEKLTKQNLKTFLLITFGTFIFAIGIYFFKFPNNFSTGGVSGISILLGRIFPSFSTADIMWIINIILLIVGCFMDPTPAVLIFTPIFLPIVQTWGMSPVHFGLMMVMNLCVGTLTPPVGAILFAGCRVHQVKIEQIIKMLLPFFAVILICLALISYVPWLTMFIPQALGLVG